jgi:hypothetical protein
MVGLVREHRREGNPGRPRWRAALRYGLFALVFLIGYRLVGWRYPWEYFEVKQSPGAGLGLALVGLREALKAPAVSPRPWPLASSAVALGVGAAVLVGSPRSTGPRRRAPDRPPSTPPACAASGRLGAASARSRRRSTPRRFLQFDVHPCPGRSPDHSHVISRVPATRQLIRDTQDPGIAFLIDNRIELGRIYAVAEEALANMYGRRKCHRIDDIFSVCVDPGRESPSPAGVAVR